MLRLMEGTTQKEAAYLTFKEQSQKHKACLFTELDPFLSELPQDLSSVDALCAELKLACIYFDVVDLNTDVFSHNPIALVVFSKLRPLVRAGLLWPSTKRVELPKDFISRKVEHYAAKSMSSEREIDVMLNQWLTIVPNEFRLFRASATKQVGEAIESIENRYREHQAEPYYPRLWGNLQAQKKRHQFDREDTIANIAFVARSFSADVQSLADYVSAEYIYQYTRTQKHTYSMFPGFTGMKLMRIHPRIAQIGFDRQHLYHFHQVLAQNNLTISYLLNLPVESLCSLLLDDAFVYLRKFHRWPDSKRHEPRQFVASNEILPQVGLKLRRTIKSSYALPILHTTKALVGQDKEAKLSLHMKRPTLIIKETATPVELSLDEHSLLKLIAYNADQVCFIEEALQQLLVSRDMDANRQFRVYSEEDVLERRSYFDSMVLYPFNKRMLRYGVQMQCRDGVLSCRYHGNASRIGLLPDDQYSSVLKSVTQLHDTLSKSKMRKIIEHIRHFITPIHSSFVMNLCELPDTYRVSRLMHRVNKKLRPLNVKIVQPSRGYYLLTFLHS